MPLVRPLVISSLFDLDLLLGWMRLRAAEREGVRSIHARRLAEAEAAAVAELAVFDAELAEAERQALDFVVAHRGEIDVDGKRSRKLAHGTVGFRTGQERLVLDLPEDQVIAGLRRVNQADCIETTSVLVKDQIKRLPPSVMREVGVHVEQDERAFVTPAKGIVGASRDA